jgi:hypothetical protein
MFLLATFALSSFAHSSILEGGCQSSVLLQTSTRERGTSNVPELNLTSWTKLFPTHRLLDLDEKFSISAGALAFETCSTMPKSYCDGFANGGNDHLEKSALWKMLNPSVYMAADGSLRTLALLSTFSQCSDPDRPEHLQWQWPVPEPSGLLVSCGSDDGCKAVGPGLDPHAFQFQGHPMAFTNQGGNGKCDPKLVNLTTFEISNLSLPGSSGCEKNWQPFTYNGTLFFSQWLHPGHKVLSCNMESYACKAAHDTSANFGTDEVHGGTPYVELDSNHFVAAANTYTTTYTSPSGVREARRVYQHKFFAIQSQPPFAVVAQTEWFQLPVAERHAHAEWLSTEYAGGLTRRGQDVILSYGVGDCVSQAVEIPITSLRQALGL